MKKIFYYATAAVLMVGCSSDSIVEGAYEPQPKNEDAAIVFSTVSKGTTRADHVGADAAALLGNNFVVMGVKSDGTPSNDNPVFDHYNVNWKENTANTTTSNSNNWEYVAQAKHAFGPIGDQSIKYWDYAKSQYDFIAYSKGLATAVYADGDYDKDANVQYTEITPATLTTSAYTIKGKATELAKTYIADMVTAYRDDNNYKEVVQFKFRSLSAKVRIALYETVPGYSVKDVVFYTNENTAATDGNAHLYTTGTEVFNEEGTYTVYYPTTGSSNKTASDYNKAHLSFAAVDGGTATTKDFGALDKTNTAENKDVAEADGKIYLGRSSDKATYAGDNAAHHYTVVIPNETGAVLNLKVNYTLVSTDGSGEVINVTGAIAKVPAIYAAWKSGYAYTYLFKISENTNGVTNPSAGPAGLYPITFDAVVTETEDGVQETITTVAEPSITTYAKGAINDEYKTSSNIYVMVNGATLSASNAKLYTVTLADGAAQTVNEASVANAIKNGAWDGTKFTVTDANTKSMVVTTADGLSIVTEIAAADAPDGNAITINAAKFTPSAAGTYVFEYVKTQPGYDSGTTLETGTSLKGYYTGTGEVKTRCSDTGTADGSTTTYYKQITAGEYEYKIIKVVE